MFHLDDIEESEDAEFVEAPTEQPAPSQVQQPYVSQLIAEPRPELQITGIEGMALYARRGRAISMFIEIPLLALVTFNDDVPGLIRAGAGLLAVWKGIELARGGAGQVRDVAQEWVG